MFKDQSAFQKTSLKTARLYRKWKQTNKQITLNIFAIINLHRQCPIEQHLVNSLENRKEKLIKMTKIESQFINSYGNGWIELLGVPFVNMRLCDVIKSSPNQRPCWNFTTIWNIFEFHNVFFLSSPFNTYWNIIHICIHIHMAVYRVSFRYDASHIFRMLRFLRVIWSYDVARSSLRWYKFTRATPHSTGFTADMTVYSRTALNINPLLTTIILCNFIFRWYKVIE